ncbi:MAG: sigma-70 family RNA polymerase sigma factor [Polyangiales bacterium]
MPSGGEQAHRRALEELYVAHERGLYNVAYRYVWSSDEARDVVQDAFVRLWNKRERIDWERAVGLAYTIVLGIARNRRRTRAVRRAFGLASAGDEPERAPRADDALDAARLDAHVRRCIEELPEKLRSALVMSLFSGLDYAEIGAALGIPAGTVGSRRTEALVRIRARLVEQGHG